MLIYTYGNIFKFSRIVNKKIKYLSDLDHGEVNNSDGLIVEETNQMLSYKLMDGPTPVL